MSTLPLNTLSISTSCADLLVMTNKDNEQTIDVPTVTPLFQCHEAASPPKLTLSAYHRPENTVRLTDAFPTRLIHLDYELLDPNVCHTLGHGASSTVRLAFHRRSGKPVAVKTIAKYDALGLWSNSNHWRASCPTQWVRHMTDDRARVEQQQQYAMRAAIPRLEEVDVLTLLRGSCPNVVQLVDVYETNTEVQLVLEYCEGGDLFDCINRRTQRRLLDHTVVTHAQGEFRESETVHVAQTLLEVLESLHSRHIVHRDIKPENILLVQPDDGTPLHVKLTDFGLARILRGKREDIPSRETLENSLPPGHGPPKTQRMRAYSCVGSDYYTAPEVHIGLGYDTTVDIYSLGVTLYVMLCGAPPSSSRFTDSLYKIDRDYQSSSGMSDGESSSTMDSEESVPSTPTAKADLFPSDSNISPLAQDCILQMIHPDPLQRITAADALKHEWITRQTDKQRDKEADPCKEISSPSFTCDASVKLPAVGVLHEIPSSFIPPSNSPKLSSIPSPSPVNLTLVNVCSKLASLVDKQRRHHRKRHRSKNHRLCVAIKSQALSQKMRPPSKLSSSISSCHRLCRNYNVPLTLKLSSPFIGPLLPQNSHGSQSVAN